MTDETTKHRGNRGASNTSLLAKAVAVTEEMVLRASEAGNLEQLGGWARQVVRVTTGGPLRAAAASGFVHVVICLVHELGADVNQTIEYGWTPLLKAAFEGQLGMVQCLVELGANVNKCSGEGTTALMAAAHRGKLDIVRCLVESSASVAAADIDGDTALLMSARQGHFSTMQFLLEQESADFDLMYSVCDLLRNHVDGYCVDKDEKNAGALASLLRVMVLRGDPTTSLVARLSRKNARVVLEGARLRARLPVYLVQRRALLDAHCPVLLPPLRSLVHGYMELTLDVTTTEELWATGLGALP
jgi:hypothetical protein